MFGTLNNMTEDLDFSIVTERRSKWLRWISEDAIVGYKNHEPIVYFSPRYQKIVTVEVGFVSDGASGPAVDFVSEAWWVHDKLCTTWKWDDETPCGNRQAALVLHDILQSEGRFVSSKAWFLATWAYGPLRYFKCFR